MKRLLTPNEAAEYLGTSRQGVYRLIHSDQLKAKRLGRSWRIHPDWLDAFINNEDTHVPHMPVSDRRRLREHQLN